MAPAPCRAFDRSASDMGTIYLLHFEKRLGRRRHYLGYTTNLEQRLKDHRLGRGGKTTARFRAAGIGFELAAQWAGSPDDERRLKTKNVASICPICRGEKMTVLEALQQAADVATRKVAMSLTDLVKTTKLSHSRVRQQLRNCSTRPRSRSSARAMPVRTKRSTSLHCACLCVQLCVRTMRNTVFTVKSHSGARYN